MNVFGAVKSVVGSWPECEGHRQGVTGAGWHMKGTLILSTHHLALGGAVPPESAGSQIIRNTGQMTGVHWGSPSWGGHRYVMRRDRLILNPFPKLHVFF